MHGTIRQQLEALGFKSSRPERKTPLLMFDVSYETRRKLKAFNEFAINKHGVPVVAKEQQKPVAPATQQAAA